MKKNLKKVLPLLGIAILLMIALSFLLRSNYKKMKIVQEMPLDVVVTNISTVDARIYWKTNTKSSYKLHYKESEYSGVYDYAEDITMYGDESTKPLIYSAKIEKLEPNTQYEFRISSSNNMWEKKYIFETAEIGEKINLPKTITGKGDLESLYLLDLDGSRYMFDTQYHGTWAFDSRVKEFTVEKYATYAHKDSKMSLFKNKIVTKLLAHEDYRTKDGVRDGMLVNDSNPIRHCADPDGCVCIFGDQNSTDRKNINIGESCSKDKSVADSMKCCRSADGQTVKWMNAKECLKVSTNKIDVYEEQSKCIEKGTFTSTPTSTSTPSPKADEAIPGFDSKIYAKFPSDGYAYDAEDIFFRLITGDYKHKDNDVDTNLVNEAWNWRRVCKDVDGCQCQYPDGSSINVSVGETCLKDKKKEDTMECCLYENKTKRSYMKVKECMQKNGFEIIEQSTKEKCESEFVCCSLSGNLKYKLDINCQKAGGVSISGVTSQNCKEQAKEIVISKGINFIEAYYILSANTPIGTAKELIVFSQNKIASVGIFRNDKWEKLVVQENGTISGEDFPLIANESYLIIATEEVKIPTSIVVSQKSINLSDYTGWNLFASSSVTNSSAKTSEQIFEDPKYNNVRQIAQWSSESSSFKYAVRDIDNNLYGDKLTITDQAGVFMKTTK
mgnify:CR=1 FL=1